jgi:hypothetical protein
VPARRQLFHATEPAPARPILLRRRDLTGEHRACEARHILVRDSEAKRQRRKSGMMSTKEEARAALEAELFALKLTKPMALPEKWAFCESAHRRFALQSKTDRLRLIIEWVDSWQALWLRRS